MIPTLLMTYNWLGLGVGSFLDHDLGFLTQDTVAFATTSVTPGNDLLIEVVD